MRGEPKWAQILWDDTRNYLIDEPAITALVAAGAIVEEENQFMVAFSNITEIDLQAASERVRPERRNNMVDYRKTRFQKDRARLCYGNFGKENWRFIVVEPGTQPACSGPCYRTKQELLADVERYAREYGF